MNREIKNKIINVDLETITPFLIKNIINDLDKVSYFDNLQENFLKTANKIKVTLLIIFRLIIINIKYRKIIIL